jgi:hypothetical protein
LRYVIAKVEDNSANIVLVKKAEREATLEALCNDLTDEPCFVVYDFDATRPDGSSLHKTCFICYSPDNCTVMAKKFAIQNFKACVMGKISSHKEMQINDKADLTENEFREAFNLN